MPTIKEYEFKQDRMCVAVEFSPEEYLKNGKRIDRDKMAKMLAKEILRHDALYVSNVKQPIDRDVFCTSISVMFLKRTPRFKDFDSLSRNDDIEHSSLNQAEVIK